MAFRLTPQIIGELLSRHAGIGMPEPLCVFARRAPAFWEIVLFGPFAAFRGRPYLVALDKGDVVMLELTTRLNVRRVRRLNLAEIARVVVRNFVVVTELIFRLRSGEAIPLRVGNKFARFPLEKSNLDALVETLERRGLLERSTSHLRWVAAGLVFGLVVLGVTPVAVRYWLRSESEAEREAVRSYLEASREPRRAPSEYLPTDVLIKIESYRAPPMPRGLMSWLIDSSETYDARLRSGKPVPLTLSDTLVEDLKILLKHFFPESSLVGEPEVRRALGAYLQLPWNYLPGYRPWTHWNFVRSLSDPERNTLARQLACRLEGWKPEAAGP